MKETSPAGVAELGSYFDHTMTLESSGFSNDTDDCSFGNAPRSLASDEELSPRRPADEGILKKSYNLVRSETPERRGRTRAARNNNTPGSDSNSSSSEDNLLNPCTFPERSIYN